MEKELLPITPGQFGVQRKRPLYRVETAPPRFSVFRADTVGEVKVRMFLDERKKRFDQVDRRSIVAVTDTLEEAHRIERELDTAANDYSQRVSRAEDVFKATTAVQRSTLEVTIEAAKAELERIIAKAGVTTEA